jgi:group I intron endonuclease
MRQKIVGVYRITNTANGMIYIGSSIDAVNRWRQHRKELRNGKHHNDKLKKAFKKYGEEAFVFEVVEVCSLETLREREQAWILESFCTDRHTGYNLTDCVESPNRGKKMSPEACAKMSKAGKGKKKPPFSDEHKAAIKAAWERRRTTPVSEETRRRQSEARKGKARPESFLQKMTGRKNTEATKQKMREATLRTMAEGRHNAFKPKE